ncbi:MAG: copper resistance protein CopC [Actinomycetota bacterium]|nr:copper resistance protein CopC [Actinomycetota bacterium]
MRRSRTRSLVVVLLLLVCGISALVHPEPARAHASLVASSPEELQILTSPPTVVRLVFDEEVDPALGDVLVTGPRGSSLRTGVSSQSGFAGTDVVVHLSGRASAGDYQVTWRAVSVDDGHPTMGAYSFRVLTGGVVAASVAEPPSPEHVVTHSRLLGVTLDVARWIAFLGFALLVGSCYFLLVCWPQGTARPPWRGPVGVGAGALVVSTVTTLLCYGAAARGAPVRAVMDMSLLDVTLASRTGHLLVLRLALLAGLAGAVLVLVRSRRISHPLPGIRAMVLVAAASLASTWSLVSHANSQAHHVPLFVLLDVAHLLAAGVWLGGLVTLGLVLLRAQDRDATRAAVSSFSSTAVVCVVVLVVTGAVQAWQRVGSPAALLDNDYAHLLLWKLGLVSLALLLGGVARFSILRVRPFRVASLRRVVLTEAGLAVAVLVVTSVLVTTEPARTAHAKLVAARQPRPAATTEVRAASLVPQPFSGRAPYDAGVGRPGQGAIDVTVVATQVGATEVHLTVLDAEGTARRIAQLVAALKPPSGASVPVALVAAGVGHYVSSGARFDQPGGWQLGVALRLPTGAATLVTVGVTVT